MMYMEVSGTSDKSTNSTTEVFELGDLRRITRSGGTIASHVFIGNCGRVSSTEALLGEVFPIVNELDVGVDFRALITSPFVESATSKEEDDILALASPAGI